MAMPWEIVFLYIEIFGFCVYNVIINIKALKMGVDFRK